MENKEKFAFRKVSMTENVEIEFIKTLEDNANKSDEDLLKAFRTNYLRTMLLVMQACFQELQLMLSFRYPNLVR